VGTGEGTIKIWIDMSAPAHVLFFRPILPILEDLGHDVVVTAREYAQTIDLLELHRIPHRRLGRHGGRRRLAKGTALARRTGSMTRLARRRAFDLAVGHGSNDLALAARALRIPAVNIHDYEYAVEQHHIGFRLARRAITPESIPPERLRRYGVTDRKLVQFPGLKEEYFLADFEPDARVLDQLGLDRGRVVVVLRPPPDVSTYHRKANPLFPRLLSHLGRREDVHAVVLPRTLAQRHFVSGLRLPSLVVPQRAVDAQSLIALADLVVSAGGTMNREAAALGTPVYTTFGGRLGGVDEELIRSGRLRPLTDPHALPVQRRPEGDGRRTRRDPRLIVDLVLGATEAAPSRR